MVNNEMEINETPDGKCSCCGNCCGFVVPYSKKELEIIKKYVKKYNIKPVKGRQYIIPGMAQPIWDVCCCFCDKENHKCLIYEVRPYVCRDFKCSNKDWQERRLKYEENADYNKTGGKIFPFDESIFDDKKMTLEFLINLVYNNLNKNSTMYEIGLQYLLTFKLAQRTDLFDLVKIKSPINGKDITIKELLESSE